MAKQKTRKSAVKRFKITKTGKLLRRVGFSRHLRRNKSARQLRSYKKTRTVKGPVARRVKRLMAVA